MPIYIKRINGLEYYYEQRSEYRPGRSPRSVMKYLGPVNPKRKKSLLGALNAWAHEQFTPEPGERQMTLYEEQVQKSGGFANIERFVLTAPHLSLSAVNEPSKTAPPPDNLPTGVAPAPTETAPAPSASDAPEQDSPEQTPDASPQGEPGSSEPQ